MDYFVYETTNLINGKKYIGKHKGSIDDDYLGSGNCLLAAIKKYGKENFVRKILFIAKDEQEAYDKEKELIAFYHAVEREDYYNISSGQNLNSSCINNTDRSYTKTPEYRQKMSVVCSGEKNGMYGRHHTEESKKKMSENSIGKNTGKDNGMYGKKGEQALNGKKVGMYDEQGNLIRVFNARSAVNIYFGLKGNSNSHLSEAIRLGKKYRGYYWKNI